MTLEQLQFWEYGWFKALWSLLTSLVTGNAKLLKGQDEIKAKLDQIIELLKNQPEQGPHFAFTLGPVSSSTSRPEIRMSTLVLTDTQKVSLAIAPVDGAGNPAPVDGVPAWASSDDSILTVEAAADGLSAVATSTGKLGAAQLSVSADADLGSGVETISGTLDVTVQAGKAVSVNISAGTPEEK